jgi:hypothetical protein
VRRLAERRFSLALPILAAIPVLLVPVLAFVLFGGGGKSGGPSVAQGAPNGNFHPVAGNFKPDDTSLDSCADNDYVCLEQGFGNIAFRQGPRAALALFEQKVGADVGVQTDCHRIAHSIGSASYARFDGNIAKTFALGSSTCASGYYHGILERAFVGVTTRAGLERVAKRLCVGQGIRPRSFLDYQCQHGLGHGMMIQSGYDLPLALAICAKLATGWDDHVCTSGVFMENLNTRFGFKSLYVRDDDPLYPCATVRLRDRRSCYVRATTRILDLNHNDFPATAKTCMSIGEPLSHACFRGYGRDAVGVARYGASKILSLCRVAGAGEGDCLYGAARTVGDGFGYAGAVRASRICQRARSAVQSPCYAGVGLVLGLLYPTDGARRAACERVAGTHAAGCAAAAIAEVDPSGRESWG